MTLTTQVIDELVKVRPPQQSARAAEIAALIRFAGSVDVVQGAVEVSAEFSRAAAAERLVSLIRDFLDIPCALRGLPGHSHERRDPAYRVEVSDRSTELVRKLGLVTRAGHRVIGLPPQVISGDIVDIEAAWRGAFIASGTLVEPGRSTSIEVNAPCMEAGLALVGCARRLGMSAKPRESRGIDKVLVKEPDAIGALLSRMGAHVTRMVWEEKLRSRESHNQARLTNFDDANLRRSARAAEVAAARVTRALDILGEDVPEHLAEAGYLRIQHQDASLEELGRLSDPQLTKDAVAGRIRRLLSMADRHAADMGIPDTRAAVPRD
ncbi:DNA-binding protein WhiA [Corynebacterium uropygiale]|uniref:Probable cell division protein WhiA n=1 Tax=Corynebacterium uropygiale TaxID=1775911 RepID=A0A9X1QPT5_9CORY|nr:DNA-binding protein WhiA [Corynebacterium uropygiale]MCF4006586.1 DNA-binding protein WhiA [Corynebacterium uropygiale]